MNLISYFLADQTIFSASDVEIYFSFQIYDFALNDEDMSAINNLNTNIRRLVPLAERDGLVELCKTKTVSNKNSYHIQNASKKGLESNVVFISQTMIRKHLFN